MVNLKNALPKLILTVALVVSSMSVAVAAGNDCGNGNKSGSGCSKDKGGTKSSKDKGSKASKDKGSKASKDKGSKAGGTKIASTPTPAATATPMPCEPPTGPTPSPSIQMVYGFGVEVVSFQEIPVDSGNPATPPSANGGAEL